MKIFRNRSPVTVVVVAIFVDVFLFFSGTVMSGDKIPSTCPGSPNCVSSSATDDRHRIAPIAFSGSAAAARQRLRKAVVAEPRSEIIRDEPCCLMVFFRSAVFGFVDEAEFFIDGDRGRIGLRSAARTGWYDFGVNRRRIEKIRSAFNQG